MSAAAIFGGLHSKDSANSYAGHPCGSSSAKKEVAAMAPTFTLFSRTATLVIGAALLLVVLWAMYMLGPTAIERWFR